jgi:hypothetical protein
MYDNRSVQPTAAVRIELEGPTFEQVEEWRRSQSKIPSRSEAVRRLLALALSARSDGTRRPSAPLHSITKSTQKFETVPATPAT